MENITEKSNENITKGDVKRIRTEQALRRKQMKRILWVGGVFFVALLIIGGGLWYSRWRASNLPGIFIADQGRDHVDPDHVHTYNSNPPTSGPHFGRVPDWGVYKEELPDEMLIHNLEHGGIWISYKPDVPEETRTKLENFYEQWGRKVIVTPRSKNDSDIALVAWNRLDKFSIGEFSEERVNRFIKAFRNKGPEFVP